MHEPIRKQFPKHPGLNDFTSPALSLDLSFLGVLGLWVSRLSYFYVWPTDLWDFSGILSFPRSSKSLGSSQRSLNFSRYLRFISPQVIIFSSSGLWSPPHYQSIYPLLHFVNIEFLVLTSPLFWNSVRNHQHNLKSYLSIFESRHLHVTLSSICECCTRTERQCY